jgi:hypothetical protein
VRFPLRRNGDHGTIAVLPLPPEAESPNEPVTPLDAIVARADVAAPSMAVETPVPPILPFGIPLKGQFTAADSRADRLIRKIRGEVEGIRSTLEQLSLENAEMMEVDIAAVLVDPANATTLPPAALVRALVAAAEHNAELERELKTTSSKAAKLRSRMRDMRLEHTANCARLETLEEVIAALHGNLEDLRAERDFARHLDAPIAPQPLRAPVELPTFPSLVERE